MYYWQPQRASSQTGKGVKPVNFLPEPHHGGRKHGAEGRHRKPPLVSAPCLLESLTLVGWAQAEDLWAKQLELLDCSAGVGG
jgi:hypothetical protein